MIKCYLCPLNDVCPVPKISTDVPGLEFKLNWLPDGNEGECPLYKVTKKKESG